MDVSKITCYKPSTMKPGPKKKPPEQQPRQVNVKLQPDVMLEIETIGRKFGIAKAATVVRHLALRGLAAYRRDKEIVEPPVSLGQNLDRGPGRGQNREPLIYAEAHTDPQTPRHKKRKGATGTDG